MFAPETNTHHTQLILSMYLELFRLNKLTAPSCSRSEVTANQLRYTLKWLGNILYSNSMRSYREAVREHVSTLSLVMVKINKVLGAFFNSKF